MTPDENDNRRPGTPLIPQRSFVHTPPSTLQRSNSATGQAQQQQAQAAAEIIRGQIDALYTQDTAAQVPQAQQPTPAPVAQPAQEQVHTTPSVQPVATRPAETLQQSLDYKSPYKQTQMNPAQVQSSQWKQYHSAWQDYYQKYYERYYVSQVQRTQQAIEARASTAAASPSVAAKPTTQPAAAADLADDTTHRDQALRELRSKLRGQITSSAVKVRKSRHFIPIAAAAGVMIVFLFLQYNRVLFANVQAYVSPGSVNSANVIIDPASELSVGDEPRLIIPKINVDVPVDYTATPDHDSQMSAMENGVAWFGIPGANSMPGQVGNTVLSGHSSNDIIDQGQYKFIFARLDALQVGDNIYANFEGKRYVYTVTKKETVKPTQVDKLIYDTDKPVLTLITCTPLGTAINRLLITAEQISPNPAQAKSAPEQTVDPNEAVMPGNSPTFLQRVFGG